MTMLLADIGGTNTRCAVASAGGAIGPVTRYRNAGHAGIAELIAAHLAGIPAGERPTAAALSVAAPITGDAVRMTNIGWAFSIEGLRQRLGLATLEVVNDFAAVARALPALRPGDVEKIGGGSPADGPRAVIGPGTGLGVATLVSSAGPAWQVVPGEGGHVTLAAQDEREEAVIRVARQRFGHCSAERVLSGAGLAFLHATLHGGPELPPEDIGALANGGDARARDTLEAFFRLLGTVAGNLALTVGATGGIYVAGGIVPRYRDVFRGSGFRERFEAKGRYRDYQRAIPTWIVTAPDPALIGLAAMAGY